MQDSLAIILILLMLVALMLMGAPLHRVFKRFVDLELLDHNVEVQSIRRCNLSSIVPNMETVFEEGDVDVLLGAPEYLAAAE